MLSIRLSRFGKKKKPTYRITVCQKHKDPVGDYIENIGHINWLGGKKNIVIDTDRAKHWISVGAQPTKTVHNLFVSEGLLKRDKKRPDGMTTKETPVEESKKEVDTTSKPSSTVETPAEEPQKEAETASEEQKTEAAAETKEVAEPTTQDKSE